MEEPTVRKPDLIHVVFDSNVLRTDRSLNKIDMIYMRSLAKLGLVKMHFPWIVYKECTSHNIADITSELDTAENKLKSLSRKGLHEDEDLVLNRIAYQIRKTKPKLKDSVEKVWNDYIRETDSILHPLREDYTAKIFEGYFSALPPFKKLKSREDIPDAYIFESLKDLALKHPIHFLSSDENLGATAATISNITVHKTFENFYNSNEFECTKLYYEHKGKNELLMMKFIDLIPTVRKVIEEEVYLWKPFEAFVDYPLSNDDHISVGSIDDVKVSINKDEVKLIDGEFYVPLKITGEASIDFFMDRSLYYEIDDDVKLPSVSDWNDHVYLAEDTDNIIFEHTIVIPASILEDKDLDLAIDELELNSDDIEEFLFGRIIESRKEAQKRRRRTDL